MATATDEWSANNSDRANAVWDRLLGSFGDSLIRKFGDAPNEEWKTAIGFLNDYQIRQGMRRMLYSGKAHPPTLPEFVKLCRTVGHHDDVPDVSTMPRLEALPAPDTDNWAIAGNRRLFRLITTRLSEKSKWLGRGHRNGQHDPSKSFAHNVDLLVSYKNRWVNLMKASAGEDGVPVGDQNDVWKACMREAEEQFEAEAA